MFKRSRISMFSISVFALLLSVELGAAEIAPESPCSNENIPRSTPSSDFRILENGSVVRHLPTRLEWQRCVVGRTWNGTQCTGSSSDLTWSEALDYAEAVGEGWRLPNVKELSSILEMCRSNPSVNIEVFPGTPFANFWSATPEVIGNPPNDYVWFVSFEFASTGRFPNSANNKVRLVREVQ